MTSDQLEVMLKHSQTEAQGFASREFVRAGEAELVRGMQAWEARASLCARVALPGDSCTSIRSDRIIDQDRQGI